MKTIEITPEKMEGRISRYSALEPLPIQQDPEIPQEANDVVYARKLLSVIGLGGDMETPVNAGAPIVDAAGMTMTIAVCPPGQGPSLHAHLQTYETFTVLKGRFEVTWNDDGSGRAELGEFDTISVPPKVNRAFRNIGDEEGVLQVLITGGVHDMTDIDLAPSSAVKLDAIKPGVKEKFTAKGLTFTAHKDAAA
ncbi:MAG: cupin domain-containing protein [Defluviicoccus sp.]|nr:cupin domain-containing protein [Defluviicoccus sp.]MDE0385492.1 cupin domain-containing protein [Defluviicoccus sp.]